MIYFFVKVVFEGVRGKDYQGDIVLDDIVIKDGFCFSFKECEFEDVNLCGWINERRYFCIFYVQYNFKYQILCFIFLELNIMRNWSIFGN